MEIERKFTITRLPDNLTSYPCHIIEQAYLNTDPVVRIRRQDDSYYMTYKGKGLLAREEYNLPLNEASYYHLLEKADGNIISKNAMSYPSTIRSSIRHICHYLDFLLTRLVYRWNWISLRHPLPL